MTDNTLWLNWRGVEGDERLWNSSRSRDGAWAGAVETRAAASAFAPAAASFADQARLLTWVDQQGRIRAGRTAFGDELSSTGGEATQFTGRPAIAMNGDSAVLAWSAAGSLQYATGGPGHWTSPAPVGGFTDRAPALAVLYNTAFCAWKQSGTEQIMWSEHRLGASSWSAPEPLPLVDGGASTSDVPALAVTGRGLAMAWKGVANNDPRLWFSEWEPGGRWSTPHTVDPIDGAVLTSHGPGLAAFDGTLVLAWKGAGSDQRVWWSSRVDANRWATPQITHPTINSAAGPSLVAYAALHP